MDIHAYDAALAQKFDAAAQQWPDLKIYIDDVSQCFRDVIACFCHPDPQVCRTRFDAASHAYSRMLRGYSKEVPAYLQVFEQAKAHFAKKTEQPPPDKDRLKFFEHCRDFLTTLQRARLMGQPAPTQPQNMPTGNTLMYRATTFLKGFEAADDGQITNWSLLNQSRNESQVASTAQGVGILDAHGTPTSRALFTVRTGQDTLTIAIYDRNPIILHCLVHGPTADLLRTARDDLAGRDLAPLPAQDPVTPAGTDDYTARHYDHRRRGAKRFNASCILAIGANRYWAFSRKLKISDLIRKMPRATPSHADGFDIAAMYDTTFEIRSCVPLGGYVTLYHLHLPQPGLDVVALDGYGHVVLIGADFAIGDVLRFQKSMDHYAGHFRERGDATCPSREFFHIATRFFNDAVPQRTAPGLALSYGNWRVGDCSFALTSIRQVADLGYQVDVLNQDSELIGLDPDTAQTAPHLRALFGEAAMKRIRFNADYLDGLTHLMLGSLGLDPGCRFAFQSRGRTYGNLWQKTMFPEWDGRRTDLVLGSPPLRLQPTQPFGIFFTLDLEKRRWLEQETFLRSLVLWTEGLRTPVRIILNGMTGYRHPHLLNAATLKTFDREEKIVSGIRSRVMRKARNTQLMSIAELDLDGKCRAISEQVHYFIGPLGSGTVVPSVLYSKPGLIYSSHALFKINRDSFKNLNLLIGPCTEMIPQHWVTDTDKRDHRIFPDAEMTSYSISPDKVLTLASSQISYHLKRSA
ncbi:hypothetical protein SAMN04488003_1315 [Loktanella fryxellensis]|uniref:Uncharacterized protein n=1 Tax=Loktanella fryxellensis TaxID=245187 RepID=A0A1H8IZI3_9RHOB|nr:hypothetical protein [Loktanella fryxellensis]SEN73892.1 hypothetical protein SAMN04488003_1315 [Loktanella fryxellensis]